METHTQLLRHGSLAHDSETFSKSRQLKKIIDNRPEFLAQRKMMEDMARCENKKIDLIDANKHVGQRKVNYTDHTKNVSKTYFNQGTRFFVTGENYQNGMIVQNVKLKIHKLIDQQNWITETENYWEGWLVENGLVKIPVYNAETNQFEHTSHDRINHDSFCYDISYADENVTFARVEWETDIYWIGQAGANQVIGNMQLGGVRTAGGLLSSLNDPTGGVEKEFVGSRYISSGELQKDDDQSFDDESD